MRFQDLRFRWLMIVLAVVFGIAATQYGNVLILDRIAFGSLPAAAAANAGAIAHSTTSTAAYHSNAARWNSVPTVHGFTAFNQDAAAPETTNFLGSLSTTVGQHFYAEKLTCNWAAAGTGGTTGVVVQLFDVIAGASFCSCTLGACTAAALDPLSCNCNTQSTGAAARTLVFRFTSGTDCLTNPANVACTATIIGGP